MGVKELAYERYKMHWMFSHGITLPEIYKIIAEWSSNPDENMNSFENYLEEYGFHGSLWCCFDEFLDSEYCDVQYMKSILFIHEYKMYAEDMDLMVY